MNIKLIYDAEKRNMEYQNKKNGGNTEESTINKTDKVIHGLDESISQIVIEKQLEHSVYPNLHDDHSRDANVEVKNDNSTFQPVKLQSIEADVNIINDSNRIIKASTGISASQLYEFVPATKLKGL